MTAARPMVIVRDAHDDDAEALAPLLATLGYPTTADMARTRCRALLATDVTARILVGVVDGRVLGVATLHVTPVVHRPTGVGRITALVVLPEAQGSGVGRRLVEASERHFEAEGLERIEVTSGVSHRDAYDFYRHLGYQDHGVRFAKALGLPQR
jgi:ribosomal protein S18 acetylase RimI-like enzyme